MTANLFGVEMDSAGNNNSGTQPFRMGTGKVQPGTTDNGMGQWKVNVGGFTDQLKIKAPMDRFNATLSGYKFNTNDLSTGDLVNLNRNVVHAPHIKVIEKDTDLISPIATVQVNLDLPVTGGYVEYDTVEDIMIAIAEQMTLSAGLACDYYYEDGDIKWSHASVDYEVYVHGLIPFICGLGYVATSKIATLLDDMLGSYDNTPQCFSLPEKTDIDFIVYDDNSVSIVDDRQSSYWCRLQESETASATLWQGNIKNPCTCAYFYQYDLSQADDVFDLGFPIFRLFTGQASPVPLDGAATNRLYYSNTSAVDPEVGDDVAFGSVVNELYQRTGTIAALGSGYMEMTNDTIVGFPYAMYWADGIYDRVFNDVGYKDALQQALIEAASAQTSSPANKDGELFTAANADDVINSYSYADPFAIKYNTKINADNPVDIFKQLLGDPDTDVGVPVALRNTAINDLFDRGSANSLGLIDFDTMESLIEKNRISGTTFTLILDEKSGVAKDIDVLALMRNVLMTHGIRMVWQWNETIRSWWLTFKDEGLGSYAEALTTGRVLYSGSVINKPINGTLGGDWYYTGITSEYKRTDGGDEPFNFKNLDSRIQHTLKDKVLSINDTVTILPSDTTGAREQIISKFSTYLQTFSTVQYKVTLDAPPSTV
jgi:hypothetical protein